MLKALIFIVLSISFSLWQTAASHADGGVSIIRDQEVEDTLYLYTRPLFKAVGLNPNTLQIFLINDGSINAFTTKGSVIFVNTGLITSASSVGEVVGVLAHETGHVAGGHLPRLYDNMKIAARNSLISTFLGGVAAIATGNPGVGMAVMMGGQHASMAGHLSYRQSEENAADQIATRILDKSKYSGIGFLTMMKKLVDQDKISLDPNSYSYLRTHPLSKERVAFLANYVNHENYHDDSAHLAEAEAFYRIKAKLTAFLIEPFRTLQLYPAANMSVSGRYARAIAYYRMNDLDKALAIMDSLLADYPNDAYFHELKGQMLFEHGRIKEALTPYATAVKLKPNGTLIKTSYAAVLIESRDKANAGAAIKILEKILVTTKDEPDVWRLLASAADITNDKALTAFAMAEYNFLIGNIEGAKVQVKRAESLLPKQGAKYFALMDLKAELEMNDADKEPPK